MGDEEIDAPVNEAQCVLRIDSSAYHSGGLLAGYALDGLHGSAQG